MSPPVAFRRTLSTVSPDILPSSAAYQLRAAVCRLTVSAIMLYSAAACRLPAAGCRVTVSPVMFPSAPVYQLPDTVSLSVSCVDCHVLVSCNQSAVSCRMSSLQYHPLLSDSYSVTDCRYFQCACTFVLLSCLSRLMDSLQTIRLLLSF